MTEFLVVIVVALVVIAASTVVAPRLGVAAPLVLVGVGLAASFLPVFDGLEIDPEWILAGVLPPLLYSAAVSMPAMDFRREFGAIGGLSVLLVVGTSLVLGLFFVLVLPDLGFAWGVALGAVVSPTDAVATSIIKKSPVSGRVVAILDGESLLNDATALVLLRTAIVAAAGSFSVGGAVGSFAWSVVVATAVGGAVGWLALHVRRRFPDATAATVVSFTVPFVAAVPTELLGASGLVAAVVAGIVTGVRAPRLLSSRARLSDAQNWRTVELVLEGAVFLALGVQLTGIVDAVESDHGGSLQAVLVAAGALALTLLVRAAYVAPLLAVLALSGRRHHAIRPRVQDMHERLATPDGGQQAFAEVAPRRRSPTERDLQRFGLRLTRLLADIEYFVRAPLGWRDGTVVVWAGMRGAVTVAAAQSLPEDAPQRPVLVLVAFAVALLSLLVQGSTVGPLVRRLGRGVDRTTAEAQVREDRAAVVALLREAGGTVPAPERPTGDPTPDQIEEGRRRMLAVVAAQRSALLDARDAGTFDAGVLEDALTDLDASELAIEVRGRPRG